MGVSQSRLKFYVYDLPEYIREGQRRRRPPTNRQSSIFRLCTSRPSRLLVAVLVTPAPQRVSGSAREGGIASVHHGGRAGAGSSIGKDFVGTYAAARRFASAICSGVSRRCTARRLM